MTATYSSLIPWTVEIVALAISPRNPEFRVRSLVATTGPTIAGPPILTNLRPWRLFAAVQEIIRREVALAFFFTGRPS
ncbi:MAG: hypothetical protein GY696_38015 [Gammaproteobacteria bacterium]|nr:hypothetical protein [Gammaproteobacteria bacterium]